MEGKGAYNRYAKLPAGGAALAMPLLEKAVRAVLLDDSERPVVIADYGSSQGKNSLAPIGLSVQVLRSRLGSERPIVVYHIDQPHNDFNSLFEVLHADSNRYVLDQPNVFPAAVGKSFYDQVLPAGSVDLGWSSYAAVWMSRVPGRVPGHFIAFRSTPATIAEFSRQAAHDWEVFLTLRARELRPGGRLIVVLPARDESGATGFEALADHANDVLGEMVAEGQVRAEERERMALASYPRRKSELLAPFAATGEFQQLTTEDCEISVLKDAVWADYERDGDPEALATKHALFFRSIFVPSLAAALDRADDPDVCRAFADRIESGLKLRLARQPAAMHSFVSTIVLAKRNPA
jgi:S-adenosylmethionine-dependent carboxyl methyltransferase